MTDLSAVLLKLFTADPTSNFDGASLSGQLMSDLSRFTEKEDIENAQLNTLYNAGVIDGPTMETSRRNVNTSILDPNGYDVYGNPLTHTATTYTGQNFQPQGNVIQNTYNPNTGYFTNNTQNGPQPVQVQPEQTKSGLLQSVNGYTGFETNAVMNNQSTTVTSYGAQPQQPQQQYQQATQQVQPQFQPQQQVQQQYPQNPQTMAQQPMQQQYQPQCGHQPYGQQQFPQFRVIQEFDNNDGNHVRVIEDVATGVVSIERTPLVNNNNRYHDAAVVSAAAIYS